MSPIRVVTDSAADLTTELAEANDVVVVPLSIRFGEEEFVDGTTLSTDEFWKRCAEQRDLPETSAPSPGAFSAAFTEAADAGCDGVVCITLSGGVSATYQSARTAADSVADRIPVDVIDTRSVTMGQGLIVLEAAEMAARGAGLDEVAAAVRDLIPRTKVLGVVGTLEHLERGGRIGGAKALLGSLLSIKPVIQVSDGVVEEESKQRTRSRSLRYLADKVRATGHLSRLAVCNGAAEDIDDFLALIDGVEVDHPLVVVDLGPVVGTHAGPGTIGVCMVTAP